MRAEEERVHEDFERYLVGVEIRSEEWLCGSEWA